MLLAGGRSPSSRRFSSTPRSVTRRSANRLRPTRIRCRPLDLLRMERCLSDVGRQDGSAGAGQGAIERSLPTFATSPGKPVRSGSPPRAVYPAPDGSVCAGLLPLALTRTYTDLGRGHPCFRPGRESPLRHLPHRYAQPLHLPRSHAGGWTADTLSAYFPRDELYRCGLPARPDFFEFYDSQIAWNGDGWTFKFADGSEVMFPEAYSARNYAQGAPTAIPTAQAESLTFGATPAATSKH